MRGNRGFNFFPIAFLIFVIFAGFTPLIPIAIVVMFLVALSNNANKNVGRTTRTTTTSYRTSRYSTRDLNAVDAKLRKYFQSNSRFVIRDDVSVAPRQGQTYTKLKDLYVYKGDSVVCSLDEFGGQFRDMYDEIMRKLITFSRTSDVFDVQATPTPEVRPQEEAPAEEDKPREMKKNEFATAKEYIDAINALNVEIPDKKITDGLYESCSLLKQIDTIEKKFPDNRPKLTKLYQYYLPILLDILNQYKDLQAAKSHEEFNSMGDRLIKTIELINNAMKTITSSLCDEDFINLSADMSTLEALLRKDGLTGEGVMGKPVTSTGGGSSDGEQQ